MNKYEEIREEVRRIIGVIIEEEFDSIMQAAKEGRVSLKEDVSKEGLHNTLHRNIDKENESSKPL